MMIIRRAFYLCLIAFTACSDSPSIEPNVACSADLDVGIDGVLDGRWAFTYDADGHGIREELDRGFDETIDEITRSTYEGDNLVAFTYDDNGDGLPEYSEQSTYDANGNQLTLSGDFDNDGVPETTDTYEYNAQDLRTGVRTDDDGDGITDVVETYVYVDDRLHHIDIDAEPALDGVPDGVETYFYDDAGRLIRTETDDDLDGTIEFTRVMLFDDEGRTVGFVFTADFDADGSPDFRMEQLAVYDERDRLVQLDFMFNDQEPERLVYQYECQEQGGAKRTALNLRTAKYRDMSAASVLAKPHRVLWREIWR